MWLCLLLASPVSCTTVHPSFHGKSLSIWDAATCLAMKKKNTNQPNKQTPAPVGSLTGLGAWQMNILNN